MLCTADMQKQHKDMDSSLERFCKKQTTALQELCLVRCAHMADALHNAYSVISHVTEIITFFSGMVSICSNIHPAYIVSNL